MLVNKIKGLFIEEEGQGMTEYGLILGAIATVVIAVGLLLRDSITGMINDVISKLPGGGAA